LATTSPPLDVIVPLEVLDEILRFVNPSVRAALAFSCRYFVRDLVFYPFFDLIYEACRNGWLEVLKFFYPGSARPFFPHCGSYAAIEGQIDVMSWLYEAPSGPTLDLEALFLCAFVSERIEVVRWLVAQGFTVPVYGEALSFEPLSFIQTVVQKLKRPSQVVLSPSTQLLLLFNSIPVA
jgi:hypothetical protein